MLPVKSTAIATSKLLCLAALSSSFFISWRSSSAGSAPARPACTQGSDCLIGSECRNWTKMLVGSCQLRCTSIAAASPATSLLEVAHCSETHSAMSPELDRPIHRIACIIVGGKDVLISRALWFAVFILSRSHGCQHHSHLSFLTSLTACRHQTLAATSPLLGASQHSLSVHMPFFECTGNPTKDRSATTVI
jgi:hypothetical protein